jgi:inorganic pyrophosphatase/exopolyphosphatase/phosphohistidine swiveling domain-containing protein
METLNISSGDIIADQKTYGGKAYWLSWLISQGYNVPSCFFIPAIDESESGNAIALLKNDTVFNNKLSEFKVSADKYNIAVRSSALQEDSAEKSFAGHFKSFVETVTYAQLLSNIEDVVKSVKGNDTSGNQKIGVVIQKKIDASFSGVLFSSNPITASKNEIVISVVRGMGEQLVSGKVPGEDILVAYTSGQPDIPSYKTAIDKTHLTELCNLAKKIETRLNTPVDIEWCVDASDELYILQCRPVTSIFPRQTGIIPINLEHEEIIPHQAKQNDKVKIRLLAQRNGIDISNAYLVVNINSSVIDEVALSKIQPEERCKGYSVVLIFPKTISGAIIRHFADNEVSRQNSAFRTCQRYDVRSYQDYGNLKGILQSIQSRCCETSWLCIAIIQEIFEPVFTGIAKKIEDGYLIEIAKGHFVPKGVVPTSQYVLNKNYGITYKNEVTQDYAYKIYQGAVSKEPVNELISLDEANLRTIIIRLLPVLSAGVQAVEFGLLRVESSDRLTPYLIDLVDDNSSSELSSRLISEGVISTGIRKGKAVILDTKSLGQNSLELHFHNHFENKNTVDTETIFVTETPDIALLEILKHYNNDKIGFVFKEGSSLSHFSIILREKNIPAIVINQSLNIENIDELTIDASTEGLKGIERLSRNSGCVTTYTNPDTDGICSAYAYAYYAKAKGQNFTPVYFGNLDKETCFIFDFLNVDLPIPATNLSAYSEIVLVDTHHTAQLSKEIIPEMVVEIIDHHPAGNPEAFPNARIQNDEIGAACTIIAELMQNEKILPNQAIAGLMAFAIISNTLNFTAPSTSKRDKDAVQWLTTLKEIPDSAIKEMFEARSEVSNVSSEEIIKSNLKEFNWGINKIGIAQVEMTDIETIVQRRDFLDALCSVKDALKLDYVLFTGVNILKRTSTIYCPDAETLDVVNKGMNFHSDKNCFEVDRILLRKTDFIPMLKKYFESNSSN